MYLYMTVLKY